MEHGIVNFMTAGAFAFGVVVGWTTYFIMRRSQPSAISDIASIIGSLGGATILTLLGNAKEMLFAGYAIGLAVGFFAYFLVFLLIVGKAMVCEGITKEKGGVMGQKGDRRE